MATIMTALWFTALTSEDRVSVKPHASPGAARDQLPARRADARSARHAARLPRAAELSRAASKDPDTVDYSTGSVGIGATAPIWGAIARRYAADTAGVPRSTGRQYSLVGDAELDEGAVWEAVLDQSVTDLGELVWIVDFNRQSLDRVVPNISATRLQAMFAAAGWQVITLEVRPVPHRAVRRARRRSPEGSASTRCRTPSTSGCCGARAAELRDRLPGDGDGAADDRARCSTDSTTPTSPGSSAAWAATTSRASSTLSTRSTTPVRRSSSPTRSRATGCRTPATRRTTRTCSSPNSSPSWPQQLGERRDRPVAALPADGSDAAALCARTAERLRRHPVAARRAARRPRGLRPRGEGPQLHPAGAGPAAARPHPARARGGAPRRDRRTGCRVLHQPRRLGQQGRRVVVDVEARLVRRRRRDDPALGRAADRPAHRARHRRGQPRLPARRARRDLEPLGRAAAADRHALRPVRHPGPRALVVRRLRRRSVDPDRHAVRCDARRRGRRAPVDHHAVDRHRAARRRRLRAGVRAGLRVVHARRARPPRPPGRIVELLPPHLPRDRPGHSPPYPPIRRRGSDAAGRSSTAATRCGGSATRVTLVGMGALMPEVLAAADRLASDRHRGRCRSASPVPTGSTVPSAPAAGTASGDAGAGDPAILDQLLPADRAVPDGHRARRPPAHAGVPRRRPGRAQHQPRRSTCATATASWTWWRWPASSGRWRWWWGPSSARRWPCRCSCGWCSGRSTCRSSTSARPSTGSAGSRCCCEAGFLAVVPRPRRRRAARACVLWLFRWLLFRVEFGAGLIKLRGDPCWRNLTCLDYHHETQPMPNPLSAGTSTTCPRPLHKAEVLGSHFAQLVAPVPPLLPQPVAGPRPGSSSPSPRRGWC